MDMEACPFLIRGAMIVAGTLARHALCQCHFFDPPLPHSCPPSLSYSLRDDEEHVVPLDVKAPSIVPSDDRVVHVSGYALLAHAYSPSRPALQTILALSLGGP